MRAVTAVALAIPLAFALACGSVEVSDLPADAPAPVAAPVDTPSRLPALVADSSPQSEDCMLSDPREWDRMLAEVQPEGSAPVVEKVTNALVETMRFRDGTELRVTRGGCAHVGETWSIAPVPAKPHVGAVRALINRVALRDPTEQPNLLSCLNDDRESAGEGFDCGEAYVTKAINGDVLEFTWSFAL